jgi:hypothetical protein
VSLSRPLSGQLPPHQLETDMLLLRNAVNYVSETIQGKESTASKDANKQVAKDDDASLSSRATAAKDAVGDKIDEQTHEVSISGA